MRWSMVPVSVAAHTVVLFAILLNPIDGDLPSIAPLRGIKFVAAAVAPPAVPAPRLNTVTRSDAAPIAAANSIRNDAVVAPDAPVSDFTIPDVGAGARSGVSDLMVGEPSAPPPPPVLPTRPTLVRAGGLIREPKKIAGGAPVYPEIARRARVEGIVRIEAIIDERGVVTEAKVADSIPLLDPAALAALKEWRYTPTLLNGVPVRVLMTITFNFQLDRVP